MNLSTRQVIRIVHESNCEDMIIEKKTLNCDLISSNKQALEACIRDLISFMDLYLRTREHPQAALIFNGLIAHAAMFVVESHRCLTKLFPETRKVFSSHSELLRESRHRAKLLDDSMKSIEEVSADLVSIAKRQRAIFFEPHSGFLGPLKRAFQPDIGLSIYNGHIFTTTHSVVFTFGKESEFSESAFAFGKEIGGYLATVFILFKLEIPSSAIKPADLPGIIEMRDIKYEVLYNRSQLGASQMGLSAGLILILANLNFVINILSGLLPVDNHLLFRMKFITAFHANSGIESLQRKIICKGLSSGDTANFFREALGNKDSRWIRKQRRLRNLLTHYLADERLVDELEPDATRVDAIECCGGGLSFHEINDLLDRNTTHLSRLLETFYKLDGDPFWFGKVR